MHYVSTLGQETPTIVSLHCSNKWPLASGGIALKIISTEVWAAAIQSYTLLQASPSYLLIQSQQQQSWYNFNNAGHLYSWQRDKRNKTKTLNLY